jgi:hypothetical protein
MPFCPECKFEYRTGIARCPECGRELVAALPSESARPAPWEREVLLCTLQGEIHAKLLRDCLQLEGIPSRAQLAGVLDSPYYLAAMPAPVSSPADVVIRIYVWERDLGHARRVYDDFERGAQDPAWDAGTEDAEQN